MIADTHTYRRIHTAGNTSIECVKEKKRERAYIDFTDDFIFNFLYFVDLVQLSHSSARSSTQLNSIQLDSIRFVPFLNQFVVVVGVSLFCQTCRIHCISGNVKTTAIN